MIIFKIFKIHVRCTLWTKMSNLLLLETHTIYNFARFLIAGSQVLLGNDMIIIILS